MVKKPLNLYESMHNGQKDLKLLLIKNYRSLASPLLLKNDSDMSAEARVAGGSDGKPYPHSC